MIIFHADDYGLSPNVSREILDLAENGFLDGISVIINMHDSVSSLCSLLNSSAIAHHRIRICLHLNLMEGHCCAAASEIPLLVDSNGFFSLSWEKLFMVSFLPSLRKRYRQQLRIELAAQIHCFLHHMPENYILSIDSHQHTHVIPVVWDALTDILRSECIPCEFIRIPSEPLLPYCRVPSLYCTYGISSWIKNIILNFCSLRARRNTPVPMTNSFSLWGIMMGCHMDSNRVLKLLPYFIEYAKRNQTLCLLFHPGQILKQEISPEYNNSSFLTVETSPNRSMERDTLTSLHSNIISSV